MESQTLYRKERSEAGRVRYVPIEEYYRWDGLHKGHYLVSVEPGCRSTRTLIRPDTARLVAAATVAEKVMVKAMLDASREQPAIIPNTARDRKAWLAYCKAMGDPNGIVRCKIASIQEIVDAGIQALIEAAAKTED